LIDVPPEVAIRATIRPGSVYYFTESSFSSSEPHYFIVININPHEDRVIFLVCASSQIEKVKLRQKMCPNETLIEISSSKYSNFHVDSIVDCNKVIEKTIDHLVEKLVQSKLKLKTEMDMNLVKQLRQGVLQSPLVENRIKESLRD